MGQLPDRPRGVRTHWKREASDPAAIGAELRTLMRLYPIDDLGDPVEAQRYSWRGRLKRIEAIFACGTHLSLSLHASGHFTFRKCKP